MQFTIMYTGSNISGRLLYSADECSFVFQADGLPYAITTIQLNDLQLAVNAEGRVLYPWGYCPLIRFAETKHIPPPSRSGTLLIQFVDDLIPGVTVRLINESGWPVAINRQEGWVCLGDPLPPQCCEVVEFASSAVAVLSEGKILALWLKPSIIHKIAHS
jgi:hypothetical protein